MSTEVVTKIPAQHAVSQLSESSAIINMIERAARDPAVDIDKMRQLLEMRAQIEAKGAQKAFDVAMTAAQSEMRPVAADATNPQTKSKYASYSALDRAVRPIYSRHGFGLSFNTGDAPKPDDVRVLCSVSHTEGHSREYHIDMPADGKGAKGGDVMTKTHATGSAVSYGMRYLLKMIFNISVGDDDGNAASTTVSAVSDEQVQEISNLLTETKSNLVLFLKKIKVESLTEIRADKFNDVVKLIKETARKRAEREAETQKQVEKTQ